jgi:hypothetical protein
MTGENSPKLKIKAGALNAGSTYTASVKVSKTNTDDVQASIQIIVKAGSLPIVSIYRKDASRPFDHSSSLRLEGSASMSGVTNPAFAFKWSRMCVLDGKEYDVCNPFFEIQTSLVKGSGTSESTKDLVIRSNALAGNGVKYKFTLVATQLDKNGNKTQNSGEASMMVVTNYMPACDNRRSTPPCIAVSPAQGETLATDFTFTAGLWDLKSLSGWNDPDGPDASLAYKFGYLLEDSKTPVLLTDDFGGAGVNTFTTSSIPVGNVWPVVIARDLVNGKSNLIVGANFTVCVTIPCGTSVSGADATAAMSAKLDAKLTSLTGATNKNKLTAVLQSTAATINELSTTADSKDKATVMRTKMAESLKSAVLHTSGPPLDVSTAASALASIAANPTQLSAATQITLEDVVDGLLNSSSVRSSGVTTSVAGSLVATVDSVAESRFPLSASTPSTSFASSPYSSAVSRRALVANKMMVQTKTITQAAAKQMDVGQEALRLGSSGITVAIRKESQAALASNTFGVPSLYHGFTFNTPANFDPGLSVGNVVIVQTTSTRYSPEYPQPATTQVASNIVSISFALPDGTPLLTSALTAKVTVSFTLSKTVFSPQCVLWNGQKWQVKPNALTTQFRSAGATVSCSVAELGSFAIRDMCSPQSTCSGHGKCAFDGKCECSLGWTGVRCATQYCDDVLFRCANRGACTCTAPAFDCVAHCKNTGKLLSSCQTICPPTPTNYTSRDCPVGDSGRQTRCVCANGYTGALCEKTTASAA